MAKKFYVKDEELGGIDREFVESVKKAEVDDYVHVFGHTVSIANGVFKVLEIYNGDSIKYRVGSETYGTPFGIGEYYKTLVPTGNVRIDGEIYRMVDRKAQVGEKVIVVENKTSGFREGHVGIIHEAYEGEALVGGEFNGSPFALNHYHDDYCVLEPADPQEGAKSDKTTADLLANLSREVVRLQKRINALEEQTDSNAKDIVTFAEEMTEHKAEQGELIDAILDAIEKLDTRFPPKGMTETAGRGGGQSETLAKRIHRTDAEDLAHNVARFVSDYLKGGIAL